MNVTYRELASEKDFSQCIALQRALFNLSDIDIVSPLILQLIARKNPPMGILLGVFNGSEKEQELIGFAISMSTFCDRSMYMPLIGVKPRYRNQGYGLNLLLKLREYALDKNIDEISWVFDPLESKLANLYVNNLRAKGVSYFKDAYFQQGTYENNPVSTDKILFKWDLRAFAVYNRNKDNFDELFKLYPVATKNDMPDSSCILVEIPNHFGIMPKEDAASAIRWIQETRYIFNHYINQHNYIIYDYFSLEENQIKKSYYLLKAQ